MRSVRNAPAIAPSVDIIVPARNEELNIGACLETLAAQTYPNLRIMVIDDCSEDSTARIVSEFASKNPKVQLIEGQDLPVGWYGKPWANHQAASLSGAEWLLFTDADVRFSPDAVRAAVYTALEYRAHLLSLHSRLDCESFWERVIQPEMASLLEIAYPLLLVNSQRFSTAIANGQFILIRRDIYEACGGHGAVCGKIVEDIALGSFVKSSGYRVFLCVGSDLLHVRMYRGFGELWRGWSKGFFEATGGSWFIGMGFIGTLLSTSVLPPALLASAVFGHRGATVRLAAINVGLMLAIRAGQRKLYRAEARYAPLHPLAALLICGMYLDSAYRACIGSGPRWKGRIYPQPRAGRSPLPRLHK